jgi:cupin 2 domain-containing protein
MPTNIFSGIPDSLHDELIEEIVRTGKVRIEKITSRGHVSVEWYDQENDEFVLLVKGEAKLRFEDGDRTIHMKAGDYLIIRAHERHVVEWTIPDEDTVWLAVHY